MEIRWKRIRAFPIIIALLVVALLFKKLLLPYSSMFLWLSFNVVIAFFFYGIFFDGRKNKSEERSTLLANINLVALTFCISAVALLLRLNKWHGWHAWSLAALFMLL